MPSPGKPGDDEKNDVLSNLPRSRRQRPSARREEAKAAREAPEAAPPNGSAAPTPQRAPEPAPAAAKAAPEPERPRRRVPASGYATVREPGSYGNADPDELLKSFVRGVLRRLPG